MRSLYVERQLHSGRELRAWAKILGFRYLLSAANLHLTVAIGRLDIGRSLDADEAELLVASGRRRVVRLDHGFIGLQLESEELLKRRDVLQRAGLALCVGRYRPHVTFAYWPSIDPSDASAFRGELRFGPELVRPDLFDEAHQR